MPSDPPSLNAQPSTNFLSAVAEWAVAWTKARAEKALVEYLDGFRVRSYLPLVRKRRVYGRHIRESDLPLFPGYVFFDKDAIERRRVLESKKVAKVLYTGDPVGLRSEVLNLSRAVARQPLFHNVPFDIEGTPVRVFKGPFKDLYGVLVKRRNKTTLVIKVTLLCRAVEMEIDEAYVERV
jgi:transcription antitermination factor NusG